MGHRRTAKEWAKLIRELERSGEAPSAFARSRGIRPGTLKWWRWRLRSPSKTTALARRQPEPVRLVAVRPVENEPPRDECSSATPVWELIAPTGHELRVYDQRGLRTLRAALVVVAGRRR